MTHNKAILRHRIRHKGRLTCRIGCPKLRREEYIGNVSINRCRECGFVLKVEEKGVWCSYLNITQKGRLTDKQHSFAKQQKSTGPSPTIREPIEGLQKPWGILPSLIKSIQLYGDISEAYEIFSKEKAQC